MWPFSNRNESRPMALRKIDDDFSVTGQITPAQVKEIAALGFRTIIAARPDGEDAGQPGYQQIAQAASEVGLRSILIPVSGQVGEGGLIRMEQALRELPRPMLGYCRSGARAEALYRGARAALR